MSERLARADSVGEKDFFRPKSAQQGIATDFGLTGLLTVNRHHLAPGAAWKLDTAGAPKPYVPAPKKPLKKGEAARCLCGFSAGYGPDMAIAQQRAMEKCFNCRLRRYAALDPRGAQDAGAIQDAIERVHREDIKRRFTKGGCSCDLPVGRLLNPKTMRPYGWYQGHTGISKSDCEEWQGGKYRAEALAAKKQKQPWWERSEAGARYTDQQKAEGLKTALVHSTDSAKSKLGGIKYSPCKSFVYPPSQYLAGSLTDERELPDADLALEFIYGYTAGWIAGLPSTEMGIKMGSDAQDNLFWVASGEIVYFAAATAIVYDPRRHRQRFFHGHDDRITCLAVSPNRQLVATGQGGQYPKVCVWSAVDGSREIKTIRAFESVPPSRVLERKVASVTFLTDAQLVAMGADDKYTVYVWDLNKGEPLARFQAGLSSPVYLIRAIYGWQHEDESSAWRPLSLSGIQLVSQGAKHISFWMFQEEWSSSTVFTDTNPLCVAFAPSTGDLHTDMFVGEQSGAISTWRAGKVLHEVKNAHRGGVTQLAWTRKGLLSGGMDCCLKVWSKNGLFLNLQPDKILDLKKLSHVSRSWASKCLVPKGLDVRQDGAIVLGTASSQILLIDPPDLWEEQPEATSSVAPPPWARSKGQVEPILPQTRQGGKVLLEGHYCRSDSDSLQGISTFRTVAFDPKNEASVSVNGEGKFHIVVTCGPDESFRFWDLIRRRLVQTIGTEFLQRNGVTVPVVPTVLDIAPNGMLIAVGFLGGQWALYFKFDSCAEEWCQIYISDNTDRKAIQNLIKSLEKDLEKVMQDPYRAQHTLEVPSLRSKIAEEKARLDEVVDYAMSEDVTVMKFAPNGFWLAVGSHDGFLKIFSIKDLNARCDGDIWHPVWKLDISHSFTAVKSDWISENQGHPADYRDRTDERSRKLGRGISAGDISMKGLRGEIKQVGLCKGHLGAVLRCDWSLDCLLLRSSSSAGELLCWEAPKGVHSNKAHEHRDKLWATNTVIFGWYLQGIFGANSTATSVNAVDVSRVQGPQQTVVTADIDGHIKLFRYPSSGMKFKFKAYVGHTSSVRNVTFTEDDTRILTLGGNDCCIFQWKYVPKFPEILREPSNDPDLSVLATRHLHVGFHTQFRREYFSKLPASVTFMLEEDFSNVQKEVPQYRQLLCSEISRCLGLEPSDNAVSVPRLSAAGGCTVAEVLIFPIAHSEGHISPDVHALQLIDIINNGGLPVTRKNLQLINQAKAARHTETLNTASLSAVAGPAIVSEANDVMKFGTFQESQKTTHICNIGVSPKRDSRGKLADNSRYPWHLEHEFVLGFQGFKQIGSFCLINNGSLVYIAAGLAVLHDCQSGRQKVFTQHSNDITCLALSPDGHTICSAEVAERPTLKVWDSENLVVLASIQAIKEDVSNEAIGITVLCRTLEAVSPFLLKTQNSFEHAQVIVRDAINDGQISAGRYIRIDDEVMLVVNMVGNALQCRRACYGSSADRHSVGAVVYCLESTFVPHQPGGIAAISFTNCDYGERIVSVGAAGDHVLVLHDWRKGTVIAYTETGYNEILSVCTHPMEDSVVTCGVDHLRFWKINGSKLEEVRPVFGSLGRNQTFLCAAFCYVQYQMFNQERWEEGCPGGIVTLTGTADGFIYMWEEHYLAKVIRYAHDAPVFSLFVEKLSCKSVVSGSRDGKIKLWDLTDFTEPPRSMIVSEHLVLDIDLPSTFSQHKLQSSSVRGLWMENGVIYVGTSEGEIIRVKYTLSPPLNIQSKDEVDFATTGEATTETLVQGHHAQILAIASNTNIITCSTSTADGFIILWDLERRKPYNWVKVKQNAARSLCFAPDGMILVAGLSDGTILFLNVKDLSTVAEQSVGPCRGSIQLIKFSPEPASFLACVSEDGQICLLDWKDEAVTYLGTVRGEPTRLPTLDWSCDGSLLATNILAEEVNVPTPVKTLKINSYGSCNLSAFKCCTCLHTSTTCGMLSQDGSCKGMTCIEHHPHAAIVACGDDLGKVSLFDYPCSHETFAPVSYVSHCGAVKQLAWCNKGQNLISFGEEDRSLILWRLVPSAEEELQFHENSELERIVKRCCGLESEEVISFDETNCNDIPLTPQYVTGLVEPLGWHGSSEQGLFSLPDETFKLHRVLGVNGQLLHSTMAMLATGELLFAASSVCVLQRPDENQQKFFDLHRKEIVCVAAHPSEDVIATAEDGASPCVHVWRLSEIRDSREARSVVIQGTLREGVVAMCFCSRGAKLACVEKDEHSSLHLYEWVSGRRTALFKLDETCGPRIIAMRCDSYGSDEIVTVGVQHVKFWTLMDKRIAGKAGVISSTIAAVGRMQIFTCVEFTQIGAGETQRCVLTGAQDGSIYVWSNGELVHVILSAHQGPIFALCSSRAFASYFWSTGADNRIIRWRTTVESGYNSSEAENAKVDTNAPRIRIEHASPYEVQDASNGAGVGSLCIGPEGEALVFATTTGRILYWRIDARTSTIESENSGGLQDDGWMPPTANEPREVVRGHAYGPVSAVCAEPVQGSTLLATGGMDRSVHIWDLTGRHMCSLQLPSPITAMDWALSVHIDGIADNTQPERRSGDIAVGLEDGRIFAIFKDLSSNIRDNTRFCMEPLLDRSSSTKMVSSVTSLRYTTEGDFLAVGRSSGRIELLQVESRTVKAVYKQYARLKGHASPVSALDWSLNCVEGRRYLRSNTYSPVPECLFWELLPQDTSESSQVAGVAQTAAPIDGNENEKRIPSSVQQVRNPRAVASARWFEETCRYSWAMRGLIQDLMTERINGAQDIHSDAGQGISNWEGGIAVQYRPQAPATVARAVAMHLLTCGDTSGGLFVFRYPCIGPGSFGHSLKGHTSAISAVTFSTDSRYVISAEFAHGCIFIWRRVDRSSWAGGQGVTDASGTSTGRQLTAPTSALVEKEEEALAKGDAAAARSRFMLQRCLQIESAGSGWREVLIALHAARDAYGQTAVREERWALLSKDAEALCQNCLAAAKQACADARDLAQLGRLDAFGLPAATLLTAARECVAVATEAAMLIEFGEVGETRIAFDAGDLKTANEEIEAAQIIVAAVAAQVKKATDRSAEALQIQEQITLLVSQAAEAARCVPYGVEEEGISAYLTTILDDINKNLQLGLEDLERESSSTWPNGDDGRGGRVQFEIARTRLSTATAMREWVRLCRACFQAAAAIQHTSVNNGGRRTASSSVETLGQLAGKAASLSWPGGERLVYELRRRIEATTQKAVESTAHLEGTVVHEETRGRVIPASPEGSLEMEMREGVDEWEGEEDFEAYESEQEYHEDDDAEMDTEVKTEPGRRYVPAVTVREEEEDAVFSEEDVDDDA